MSKEITVRKVVQDAVKGKAVSVGQVKKYADAKYKELGITEKQINDYLYSEYYSDGRMFTSCESFEKEFRL